ncbi:uncharacterized protein LOC106142071 isoform X1 [Amyelois transitella]|uniref:uncharacterized protein LOC106142071 isoform X1 n=1 Tax=Amyelois transitella TaxID=680683 RepID=UPI0029904781|nr:uncharacterized protein LOC106142071 isoform X1 [Amyelois transitella]
MLTPLILHLVLPMALPQEIRLESLDNGPGILPFKLGEAKIISHHHSFIQNVNLDLLQDKINSVNDQLLTSSPDLHNKTNLLFQPHIDYLKNKLKNVSEQLKSFETGRVKRGLIDGLGSVVKSITGNLDYTDALHYNHAIKALEEDEHRLATEFNQHVSLTKDLTSQYSKIINDIVKNQNKMADLINRINESDASRDYDLIKYAHLAQMLIILSDNVDSISQELTRLQNILAFIRTSTMHHSAISLDEIRNILHKLTAIYGRDRIIDLDIREYYELVRLGSYYVGNNIVIVYKFPIFQLPIYDLYKLSIIPNRFHEVLIPPSPFLAIFQKDFKNIEAECPKSSKWFICEEKRSLQNRPSQSCIPELITTQKKNPTCQPIAITLDQIAYEELDDRYYTINFPSPTKIHLSCGQDLYKEVNGSYLLTIPQNCYIETSQLHITNKKDRLKGHVLKIMDLPHKETNIQTPAPTLKLNSINLEHLHTTNTKIMQESPHIIQATNDYGIYHTTIPLYLSLFGACALVSYVAYRKYVLNSKGTTDDNPQSCPDQPERIYTIPEPSERTRCNQPPPQFTTKIIGGGCSSAGGVTRC